MQVGQSRLQISLRWADLMAYDMTTIPQRRRLAFARKGDDMKTFIDEAPHNFRSGYGFGKTYQYSG